MKPGQPMLFSGKPLYVLTGRRENRVVEHIAFESDWDVALERANKATPGIRDGYTEVYVSMIMTRFS